MLKDVRYYWQLILIGLGKCLLKTQLSVELKGISDYSYVSKNVKLQPADFLINISSLDILKTLLHKCRSCDQNCIDE